jgi:hypothetical protein
MSCHCHQCKKNFLTFYKEFFERSPLFDYYSYFTENYTSDEEIKRYWNDANTLLKKSMASVYLCLNNGVYLDTLNGPMTKEELSEWILDFVCEDCWANQPLPHSEFFYFISPIFSDVIYVLESDVYFTRRQPELVEGLSDLFIKLKNGYQTRNGLLCSGFVSYEYHFLNLFGYPMYLHGIALPEDIRNSYEIRKRDRFNSEIECHPKASRGLLWKLTTEMFDDDGLLIKDY